MTATARKHRRERRGRRGHRPCRPGHRPRRGRRVPGRAHAGDLLRAARGRRAGGRDPDADARGRAAHRRRHRARDLHAAHRRPGPGRRGDQHRRADLGAGRRRDQGARVRRPRQLARRAHLVAEHHRAVADPPRPAGAGPARAADSDVHHRHQGHRPAHPVRAGREDRAVRRGRRGQDRADPGDDPPGGPELRRRLGLRRGGRADPRGQRPVPGDDRVRASSRTPRWCSARWTSRPASGCGSGCPR